MKNKNKKNVQPEKIGGKLRIAGKDFKVGSIKGVESSPEDLKKAVRRLSKKRIFSLPAYVLNE